ncbi:alpha/beta hydrolase [Lolliginicoccus lacisalsi]|uniref:alpha/beta hydrolase n=1 Tax=Lolliginicoccus lacisalsi TaxID=2742202 RepID=UPI001CDB79F2|nr:alpha/beta hydrolase [Lolliginicoccus lacisalsi]
MVFGTPPAMPRSRAGLAPWRRRAVIAVALGTVFGIGATACAEPAGGDGDRGLARFYEQAVDWGACAGYAEDPATGRALESTGFECARVTVPLDYGDPGGATAELAVTRLATATSKIGSLVVNPGGPGASGIGTAANLAQVWSGTELADRFDLVSWDPRGVAASTPEVQCLTGTEMDEYRRLDHVDMSAEGIARTEADMQRYIDACAERSGMELLTNVGTRENVLDLDILRSVLGDDELNYLGYSYGTYLGARYAERFPGSVRAMVLDGAVDPAMDLGDSIVQQGQGFQRSFDAFVADCGPRPECPLSDDRDVAIKEFRALVDPLVDSPAWTSDGRGLGYSDAMSGVIQALYSPQLWRLLRSGLIELGDGIGDPLLLLADTYEGRQDDGSYFNSTSAFHAVNCVDTVAVTDREQWGQYDTRYRSVAPFTDDGRGTGQAPLDICAFWPVDPTSGPAQLDIPDSVPPSLVVSTTGDPATPYEAGVELAQQLGGGMLTYEGDQHTVVLGLDECVDTHVTRYLVDLRLPPEGERC